MDPISTELMFKIGLSLCTIIGILIGVIWHMLRKETFGVKESVEEIRKMTVDILLNYVKKEDCLRMQEDKKNKDK